MTKSIKNNYSKYLAKKTNDSNFFSFFKISMSEILTRTTKLEGERVNKKFVKSLFYN